MSFLFILFLLFPSLAFAADEVLDIPATKRQEGEHKFNYTLKQTDKRVMSFVIERTAFSDPLVYGIIRVNVVYPQGTLTCGIKIVGGTYPSSTSSQTCTPPSSYTFIQSINGTLTVADGTAKKNGSISGSAVVTFR
jgi:hypothetical protein